MEDDKPMIDYTEPSDDEELLNFSETDGTDEMDTKDGHEIKYDDFYEPSKKITKKTEVKLKDTISPTKKDDKKTKILQKTKTSVKPEDQETSKEPKTIYEKERDRKKKQIKLLEENLIAPRSWELMGEISAENRPLNSALEKFLEFDVRENPTPKITKEFKEEIESMIKRKILVGGFEQRNPNPPDENSSEDQIENLVAKNMEISQEKATKGLGQIYEEEFLRKQTLSTKKESTEEMTSMQKNVLSLFSSLSNSLDALSNFHFTPKPRAKEWEMKKMDIAAIQLEEKLPATETVERISEMVATGGKEVEVRKVRKKRKKSVFGISD